jgi:hypothetical protein
MATIAAPARRMVMPAYWSAIVIPAGKQRMKADYNDRCS